MLTSRGESIDKIEEAKKNQLKRLKTSALGSVLSGVYTFKHTVEALDCVCVCVWVCVSVCLSVKMSVSFPEPLEISCGRSQGEEAGGVSEGLEDEYQQGEFI